MDLKAMGRVGLGGGIQGKIGRKVAEPVAEHTRLSVEQVEAIIGGILLIMSVLSFVKLLKRVWRAGNGTDPVD